MNQEQGKEKSKSRLLRGLVIAASAVLVLVVIAAAGAFWLLRTDSGRARLEAIIERAVSSEDLRLEIEGLGGRLPGEIICERVTVSDTEGAWLDINDLEIILRLTPLLRDLWYFEKISAGNVDLARLPQNGAKDDGGDGGVIPKAPKVVVEELSLERVAVDESAFGRAAVLRIVSEFSSSGDKYDIQARAERLDRLSDALRFSAAAPSDLSALSLNATLSEAPGGLLGGVLGLPEGSGLEAELSGGGPLKDWSGDLWAVAPGAGRIKAGFRITGDRGYTLKAQGELSSEVEAVTEAFWRLVGREADFNVEITRLPDGGLVIPAADVATVGIELKVRDAGLSPDLEDVKAVIEARVGNHEAMADLAGMDALKLDVLNLDISGGLNDLDYVLEAKLAEAAAGGVRAADAVLGAKGVLRRAFSDGPPGFTAAGSLDSARIELPYNNAALSSARVGFDASSEKMEKLDVARLDIAARGVDVKAKGAMLLDGSSMEADLEADLREQGLLRLEYGDIKAGGLGLNAVVKGSPRDVRFEVQGRGVVRDLSGLHEAVADLAGGRVEFSGPAKYENGVVSTEGLDVRGAGASLKLSGELTPESEEFAADFSLKVEDPEWVRRRLGLELAGKPTVSGSASGTFKDFRIEIKAVTDGILFGGESFKDLEVEAAAGGLPGNRRARAYLGAEWRGRRVSLDVMAAYRDGLIELNGLVLDAPGIEAEGDAAVSTENGLVKGSFSASIERLSEYSDILGGVRGSADLSVELTVEGGEQGLSARAVLSDAGYDGGEARSASIDLSLAGLWGDISGVAAATLEKASFGPADIDEARIEAKGGPRAIDLRFSAGGGAGKPFRVRGEAGIERDERGTVVNVGKLSGEFAGVEAKAVQTAQIRAGPRGLELSGLDLAVGRGRLTASGRIGPDEIDAAVGISGLTLAVLEPFYDFPLHGDLDAEFTASGPPENPTAEFQIKLAGIRPVGIGEALPAEARISGTIRGGALNAGMSLASNGEEQLTVRLDAPVEFSVSPFGFSMPGNGALDGRAEGVLNLAAVRLFLDIEDQYVSGRAPLSAEISGTVADPRVRGSMRLENARYEHLRVGAVLDGVTGDIDLYGDRIQLREIVGGDGKGGKFYVNGEVFLDTEKGVAYDLTLEPRHASLINTDYIQAVVHGALKLSGDSSGGSLKGGMTIDPAHIRLPERVPPEVVEIEVEKIGAAPGEYEQMKANGPGYELGLDVAVDIPARFFVRGRGLDAEFEGDLRITGTAAEPDVRGEMNVVRGYYDFLDKRLALERGSLVFTGGGTTPLLDVVAVNRAGGVAAMVRLTGPADDFSLELSSDPPMPENEIMARLLFGRSAGDLNPVQAIQLANALGRLTGTGGGPDILGEARRTLGLDQLQISGGEQGAAPAVGVGKYLRENVYLQVERDFTTGGEEVSVDVELTPKVGVSGRASHYSGSEVGVHWKKNY